MKRWIQRIILTAAAAGAAGAAVYPRVAAAQTSSPAVSVDDAKAADLQLQSKILSDPSSDAAARDEAARRLVSRRSADAQRALLAAIGNSSNPRGQLSVARALAEAGSIDPSYVDPLFSLIGQDRALSDAACDALANFKSNSGVLNRLIDLAQNTRDSRETARASATRAVGAFVEKRAAKVLMDLLQNSSDALSVRNAAADGLSDLTGLTENGRDLSLWQRWWAQQNSKSDAAFREDLLAQRTTQSDRLRERQDHLVTELQSLLKDQYQASADAGKDALLLKWMQSPEPQVRTLAAELVVEDFQYGRPFGSPVKDQLRTMVGDSSAAVRLQVARTVRTINDTSALDALLTQLSQEPVAENRAAIALALSKMNDLRAVPELEKLLSEQEPLIVVEAGATALTSLGQQLFDKDPAAALRVAGKLRDVLAKRTDQPGAEHLREVVVEALVPLRDPQMLTTYFRLLNLRETERTRRATLRGIAALGNKNAADAVVSWLKDEPLGSVRREAIEALGTVGGTEQFETLYQEMQPSETEPEVRDAAWKVFTSLLPQASTEQINRWPGRFSEPDKRVIVLKALADKLLQDKNLSELAKTQQNIGEALMKSTPPQPTEAATYYKLSLDYYQHNNSPAMVIETNIGQLLDALLQSKQYAEAVQFSSKLIQANPGNQQTVGPKFTIEADRLFGVVGDLQSAQKLITEAKTMQPALDSKYSSKLTEIERDVQQRLTTQNKNPGTTGPLLNPNLRVG